jgi:predicted O-linked N-acetylglucosamine transferase (SPINDLY family)
LTIQQTYDLALEHHRAGRLSEAGDLYRRILAVQPGHFKALKSLGALACQLGQYGAAIEWCRQATAVEPNDPGAWSNLGAALSGNRQLDAALTAYRRALELQPDHADATYNFANALRDSGRIDEAVAAYRRALQLKPTRAEAGNNLGLTLELKGQFDEAVSAYQQALASKSDHVETLINLGKILIRLGRIDDAIAALRRAIELQPDCAEAHYNLGVALHECDILDGAVHTYRRALAIKPDFAEIENNLGNTLRAQGLLDEAIASYRRALLLRPGVSEFQSNLILALHYHPAQDDRAIEEEQQRWNRKFGHFPAIRIPSHVNDRNPDRRLRIGYVSGDLRDHVVGRNVAPLFRYHDHPHFEVCCYSGVERPDKLTETFRQHADLWRDTARLSDEALAQLIRQDRVDILVDLSQHTAGHRLAVFARQPAPVQVSFAGYPESTGLEAIAHRISDRWLESEMADRRSEIGWKHEPDLRSPNSDLRTTERVFLIDSFWCFDPCGTEAAVNESPAGETGRVTFGSLHSFGKINEPVLRLWAQVLHAVPGSRLILQSGFGSHRQRTRDILGNEGIPADRVDFVPRRPRHEYLELHHRLDIVLDPFPYGGHTTSLEALWMGVPVVSLAGRRPVSRAGLSILNNLGLPELVATSKDDYIKIAGALAGDLPRLAALRRTLRSRMETSVLMDAPRFARGIESAYRAMWRHWCAPVG